MPMQCQENVPTLLNLSYYFECKLCEMLINCLRTGKIGRVGLMIIYETCTKTLAQSIPKAQKGALCGH